MADERVVTTMTQIHHKLGLVAVASPTGLGYQTKSYYKHLKPSKTLVVDISGYNGAPQYYSWYSNAIISKGFPTPEIIRQFLDGLEVILTAETPYNFDLYAIAREMGIKTICVENPEFYDYIAMPEKPMPDMMILPSTWLEDEIRADAESKGVVVKQIHHPVDREDYPFKLRQHKRFLHIAGNPASNDRNGTWDFLQACPTGTVTTQRDDFANQIAKRYRHSKVYSDIKDNHQLYELGDILVLPRRYGGNCLPVNEALSSGLPVIMPDIVPNNNLLPTEWLVPADKVDSFTPRTKVDIYSVDSQALVDKLSWLAETDIEAQSLRANEIAETISWTALLSEYIKAVNEICEL